MYQNLIANFAAAHRVPQPDVRAFVAAIAAQCALVANRFEPQGELECLDLGAVEAVGAQIGEAIISAFPEPDSYIEPTALELGWGTGGVRKKWR